MRYILWFSLVLTVIAHISGPLDDPDLWWHITIGRWIVAHGTVPQVDYWTLFGNGQPWRAYSWSVEVVFALVERWSGLAGLLALKTALTVLLGFSAQFVFASMSGSLGLGSLLAAFYTASVYNHLTLRPQTLIWVLFLWVMYVAHQVSSAWRAPTVYSGSSPFNGALANVHLSAILGLGLLFSWVYRRDQFAPAAVVTVVDLWNSYYSLLWR